MAHTLTTLASDIDLSGAERMALWSLRHILRHEPPRCHAHSPQHHRGFDADLARVSSHFRHTLDQLAGALHLSARASLSLNNDERLLLRCLARLQCEDEESDDALAALLPDPRLAAFLGGALVELAAALATGGYWLPARAH